MKETVGREWGNKVGIGGGNKFLLRLRKEVESFRRIYREAAVRLNRKRNKLLNEGIIDMPIKIQWDGENLIFTDYLNRKVTIQQEDYLGLMKSEERQAIRPILEDCLADPDEVWWLVENSEGQDYTFYKYFKVYKNLIFVAYVLLDETMNFHLNNFYGFEENEFKEADKERCGKLILSKLR